MAILGITAAGINSVAGAGSAPRVQGDKFGSLMKQAGPRVTSEPRGETAGLKVLQPATRPAGQLRAQPGPSRPSTRVDSAQSAAQQSTVKVLEQVTAAQRRMEQVLELAQSGKSFTPAELISLQSQAYRASQELDLAGKVVEKATGGVKQVLQTQV